MGASFFHVEQRLVRESYTEQESYSDSESYSCGSGTLYRTCTRSVTRYRSVTKYRTVMRPVQVSDGTCAIGVLVSPQVGHMYVIDFTYRENNACSATCAEQMAILSDGSFQLAPCPSLTPQELRAVRDDQD